MTPTEAISDWRTLAEQASVEQDEEKLAELIKKLCDALDRHTVSGKDLHAELKVG